MEAVEHGMKPKNGKGPSVKVAKEFVKADQPSSRMKDKAARQSILKALLKKKA